MDTKHDIPHREIGEQDDELLEQLWKQLPDSQEDPFIADQGFKDLQGRIQRKLRIKRRFRILTAGSIAAALITGVLIFRTLIPSEQVPTAIAQLQDMGVTISDDQVILKMWGMRLLCPLTVQHVLSRIQQMMWLYKLLPVKSWRWQVSVS